jgi:hypothetical protein
MICCRAERPLNLSAFDYTRKSVEECALLLGRSRELFMESALRVTSVAFQRKDGMGI